MLILTDGSDVTTSNEVNACVCAGLLHWRKRESLVRHQLEY